MSLGTKSSGASTVLMSKPTLAERLASRKVGFDCIRLIEAMRLILGSKADFPLDDTVLKQIATAFMDRNWSVNHDDDLDDLSPLRHERNKFKTDDRIITDDMIEFRNLVARLYKEIKSLEGKDEKAAIKEYADLKDQMIFSAAKESLHLRKWLSREFWTREQASALFVGLDPDGTPHRKMKLIKNSEIAERYLSAQRIFDDFAQSRGHSGILSLKLLRKMAEESGIEFPRNPAQRRNLPESEKTLRAGTVNSLVLLLATKHYAFDHIRSNIDEVAKKIVADLEEMGIPLVEKTVVNALRNAASWLGDKRIKLSKQAPV